MTLAETLPDRKARVCGTVRTSKGLSTWPRTWSQALENTAVSVLKERWHNSPSEADTRLVQMISTINNATAPVNTGRQDRRTDLEIKKPYCFPVQQYHEGHRYSRQVPQLLVSSEENGQMAKCIRWTVHPDVHFCIQNTNTNKNFLQEVARSEISQDQNPNESSSDELLCPEK